MSNETHCLGSYKLTQMILSMNLTLSLRRHLYNAPSCYTEHHKI